MLQPLAKISGGGGGFLRRHPRKQIVIVVDALDECDNENDIKAILALMPLGARALGSCCLRVLLTSRPETPVRYGIEAMFPANRDCMS